jgi:hypothetical protein
VKKYFLCTNSPFACQQNVLNCFLQKIFSFVFHLFLGNNFPFVSRLKKIVLFFQAKIYPFRNFSNGGKKMKKQKSKTTTKKGIFV